MNAAPAVLDEWLRRVEAEYLSAATTQELGLWLLQLGASPDLIKASLLIVEDELIHSEDAFHVYREAGGKEKPNVSMKGATSKESNIALESKILERCIYTFCLGETIAVPLFTAMRKEATVPIVCTTLDRVLKDEVRHREFGWALLAWLQTFLGKTKVNEFTERALPTLFDRYVQLYGQVDNAYEFPQSLRAWGLISPRDYRNALQAAVDKTIAPRLNSLDIPFQPTKTSQINS